MERHPLKLYDADGTWFGSLTSPLDAARVMDRHEPGACVRLGEDSRVLFVQDESRPPVLTISRTIWANWDPFGLTTGRTPTP